MLYNLGLKGKKWLATLLTSVFLRVNNYWNAYYKGKEWLLDIRELWRKIQDDIYWSSFLQMKSL